MNIVKSADCPRNINEGHSTDFFDFFSLCDRILPFVLPVRAVGWGKQSMRFLGTIGRERFMGAIGRKCFDCWQSQNRENGNAE